MQGFSGDLDWVIQSIQANSTSLTSPILSSSPTGGVVVYPGIDLGHCGERIFEESVRQLYPTVAHRVLLRKAIDKRGNDASAYMSTNATEISQLPDLTSTPNEQFTSMISIALEDYWNQLIRIQPRIQSEDTNPICQTVLLHFAFIHGLRSSRRLSTIIASKTFNSQILLAREIFEIRSKTNSAMIDQACQLEISYLLNNALHLTDTVGLNAANQTEDVTRVATRLCELGFLDQNEFYINNGVVDWTPLTNFIQIIESGEQTTCSGVLQPGGLIHLWLSCSAAPKMESKLLNPFAQQPTVACDWFWDTVVQTSKELIRVCRTESETTGVPIEVEFSPFSLTSFGLEFNVGLPSSSASNCNSTTDPNFDRPMMKRICQSLLSRQYVGGVESLLLSDQEISLHGLATIGGTSSHLTVKIHRPKLSEAESIEIVATSSVNSSSPTTEDTSENLSIPTNPTDEVFDYYMDLITSVNSNHFVDSTARETLHLLGISGWKNRRKVTNLKDAYNDTIIALWMDSQGTKVVKEYVSSTAPGKFSKFYNTKGDAHLISGRYAYKRGTHKGYDALVQAEKFKVWRDKHKDGDRRTDSIVEEGWYGINIHAAGTGTKVGNWSAGCQVIWGGRDAGSPFETFMTDVHSMVTGNDLVYYTLVDSLAINPLPEVNNGGGQ